MNIFLFDPDLQVNAKYFKDKDPRRFNKQIVESTQLLAASMKHYYNITLLKKDGSPYTVDRILHHPACKWLLIDSINHRWHLKYLLELLRLSPNHSCNVTVNNAITEMNKVAYIIIDSLSGPYEYLCITNSDMTGLPDDATVFDKYKRHLENKHRSI